MDVAVPHGEFAFVFNQQIGQFQVQELARHISVTRFQDRMLLWAGYHRSYAFMTNENPDGIERSLLVALTTDADFLVSAQSPNQGLRAVICGLRPPLFRDFLDRDLFMDVNLKENAGCYKFALHVLASTIRSSGSGEGRNSRDAHTILPPQSLQLLFYRQPTGQSTLDTHICCTPRYWDRGSTDDFHPVEMRDL
jgi:hypothetical protein